MAVRANWKGYLKLSLVSCAVALYPAASTSSRVRFHTINRTTGNRIKPQYVDSVSGEPVDMEDRVRGYEVAKNTFVLFEDADLDAIRIESSHTIDIESFVPVEQVDKRYLEAPYYLAPDDTVAQEAFAVIRDAMKAKRRAGVARVVLGGRERTLLLEPLGRGIMATVLRYPYEVRSEEPYFEEIPALTLPREMATLAEHIVETKSADFDPTKFEDRLEAQIAAAIANLPRTAVTTTVGPIKTQAEAIRPLTDLANSFEALLNSRGREEEVQQFLKGNPQLLDPGYIEVHPKLKLGSEFITDFVHVVNGYNGREHVFVEIERPDKRIFTDGGQLTSGLTQAKNQLLDWEHWIDQNKHYLKSKLPTLGAPTFHLVFGRSAELNDKQRFKLSSEFTGNKRFSTYDDLLDRFRAIFRHLEAR